MMQPFSGTYIRCPKCDYPPSWVQTTYCPGGERDCPLEIEGGHLHRNCSHCGWEAVEQPADAKETAPCQP